MNSLQVFRVHQTPICYKPKTCFSSAAYCARILFLSRFSKKMYLLKLDGYSDPGVGVGTFFVSWPDHFGTIFEVMYVYTAIWIEFISRRNFDRIVSKFGTHIRICLGKNPIVFGPDRTHGPSGRSVYMRFLSNILQVAIFSRSSWNSFYICILGQEQYVSILVRIGRAVRPVGVIL